MSQRLYIVHGWAYSIEPWADTVARLREHNVDVVQLRVPGLTSPSDAVWTIDSYVDWLAEQLEHEPEPIVLGHSNGGRIAMHFASKYPSRLKKLILLNSAGVEVDAETLSTKRKLFAKLSKIFGLLKYIPLMKKIVYRMLGSDYGLAPKNMQQTLANMLASDKDFDPSTVTAPTAILWGERDRITPPQMGRILHAAINDSTLQVFDGWAHAPYRTDPEQLAGAILAALGDKS